MDVCGECGFEYRLEAAGAAGAAIVADVAAISALIAGNADRCATRSAPDTWSPLEYACHVRDVLLVQRERVLLARRVDQPDPAPMGRDERVEHDGYAAQDPHDVARQITDASALFANVLDRLGPDDWDRTMLYNYPTKEPRSLRWVAIHTQHETHHHLGDARRGLS